MNPSPGCKILHHHKLIGLLMRHLPTLINSQLLRARVNPALIDTGSRWEPDSFSFLLPNPPASFLIISFSSGESSAVFLRKSFLPSSIPTSIDGRIAGLGLRTHGQCLAAPTSPDNKEMVDIVRDSNGRTVKPPKCKSTPPNPRPHEIPCILRT